MDVFSCVAKGACDAPVRAALIAAVVTVLGLLASSGIALLTWSSTRRHNKNSLEQTRELATRTLEQTKELAETEKNHDAFLQRLQTNLDLNSHSRKKSFENEFEEKMVLLKRLRDLQRSAEDTQKSAALLKMLAYSPSQESQECILAESGNFLIAASGIFYKPPRGAPNIPETVETQYQQLCRSVVKVTLLLDLNIDRGRMGEMDNAVQDLDAAVDVFKRQLAIEEQNTFRLSLSPVVFPDSEINEAIPGA